MSDGELDRRRAERDAADRHYNDALTKVDEALPRVPEAPSPVGPIISDARALREHAGILPAAAPAGRGWRGRLGRFVWRLVAPVFARQQELDDALIVHAERTSDALRDLTRALDEARDAHHHDVQALITFNSALLQYLQQITPFIDTKARLLDATLDEVRMAAAAAQRAARSARHEIDRPPHVTDRAEIPHAPDAEPAADATTAGPRARRFAAAYVGFEDLFRGAPEEIRKRQADYVGRFAGASSVLDIGCGRGEFLDLLKEHGIDGEGIDLNADMVEACRARGLRAQQADALGYLTRLPDDSLGGLIALQVVEHLEPEYLVGLLDTAFAKLRPGASIVLETINAACWVAFFESYIRDITHVRPLHPETLKFLVIAAGFERVDVHFRSPVAEHGRLQRASAVDLPAGLAGIVHTINANVERLNERLFTYLDYAVVAIKQP